MPQSLGLSTRSEGTPGPQKQAESLGIESSTMGVHENLRAVAGAAGANVACIASRDTGIAAGLALSANLAATRIVATAPATSHAHQGRKDKREHDYFYHLKDLSVACLFGEGNSSGAAVSEMNFRISSLLYRS